MYPLSINSRYFSISREFLSSSLKFRSSVEVPLSKDFCRSNCVDATVNHRKYNCIANKVLDAPVSSSAPRPLGAAYVSTLLSEVEQGKGPSGNGDREAIVVGAGLCDKECEREYTVYDLILGGERLNWCNQ